MSTKIKSYRLLFGLLPLTVMLIYSSDAYAIQIANEQKQNCKRVQHECLKKLASSKDFVSCLDMGPPGCADYSFEIMKEFEDHIKRVEYACKTERQKICQSGSIGLAQECLKEHLTMLSIDCSKELSTKSKL